MERSREVSAIEAALAAARAGSGRSLLLSGPAGIGRSALADRARVDAAAQGFTVLACRLTPVSRTMAHAVVRDWVRPLLRRPATDQDTAELADLAAPLAAPRDAVPLDEVDGWLRRLLDRLAALAPVLLVVDDVQWADAASLQLLDLVVARLEDGPTALVTTRRAGEPCDLRDLVYRLSVGGQLLEPAPLSAAGVAELLGRAGAEGRRPLPPDAVDLHRRTGGVPFLVHALLGVPAGDPDGPGGPALPTTLPTALVEWLRDRVERMPAPARAALRAVAVLGSEASLDAVAALCDVSVADLADPVQLLTEAALVTSTMWRVQPAAPVLADAVLAGLAPSERSALHARAAQVLAGTSPARLVAAHLAHTLPGEDTAVVRLLRSAGEEALAAGVPEEAATLLLRAVGEVAPEHTAHDLLLLAASAHLSAGRAAEALDLWRTAAERAVDPGTRAGCLRALGDACLALGDRGEARSAYADAGGVLAAAALDGGTEARLLLGVRVRMTAEEPDREHVASTVASAARRPPAEDTTLDRLRLAVAARDLGALGREAQTARTVALRALADGLLLDEEGTEVPGLYLATDVLVWCESFPEAVAALDAAVDRARASGSSVALANALCARGLAHVRLGEPHRARADLESSLGRRPVVAPYRAGAALAGLAATYLALGRAADAQALAPELLVAGKEDGGGTESVLLVAGLLHSLAGDDESALGSYRAAGRTRGVPTPPALAQWRELSALSLRRLGRTDEARELAAEGVRLARMWGSPRTLAFSLRVLGRLVAGDEAPELLREAVELCAAAGAEDHRARAAVDLGGLLMRGGRTRAEGQHLLEGALAYGQGRDVPSITQAASAALRRHGVSVPGLGDSPLGRLTRGEQRVAELAASGLTNRAIARELFVTVKAVEWHLSNAYKKLAISSRAQLTELLGGQPGGDPAGQLDVPAEWASSSAR